MTAVRLLLVLAPERRYESRNCEQNAGPFHNQHDTGWNRSRVDFAKTIAAQLLEEAVITKAAGESPGRGEKPLARLEPASDHPRSGQQERSHDVVVEERRRIFTPC